MCSGPCEMHAMTPNQSVSRFMEMKLVFIRDTLQDSRSLSQLCPVKLMIGGLRVETALTYSQTLNGHGASSFLIELRLVEWKAPSGPFLVSRTGDAG